MPGAGAGGGIAQFLPLILIFVVFYFLLIRPQQKQAKQQQQFLNDLKNGASSRLFMRGKLPPSARLLTDEQHHAQERGRDGSASAGLVDSWRSP